MYSNGHNFRTFLREPRLLLTTHELIRKSEEVRLHLSSMKLREPLHIDGALRHDALPGSFCAVLDAFLRRRLGSSE